VQRMGIVRKSVLGCVGGLCRQSEPTLVGSGMRVKEGAKYMSLRWDWSIRAHALVARAVSLARVHGECCVRPPTILFC
jgi:hypothetical protein